MTYGISPSGTRASGCRYTSVVSSASIAAIPLNDYAASVLGPVVLARSPEQTLIVNGGGSPLSPKSVNRIVSALAKQARVTYKRITPHTLRHTLGPSLKDKGVDIETIRVLLRHSRIAETGRYLHSGEERTRDAVERLVRE